MPDSHRTAAQYWGEGKDIPVEDENILDSCRGDPWSIDPSLFAISPISGSLLLRVEVPLLVLHVTARGLRVLFPAHMTVLGHVHNGAIVLDQPLQVPEGTVARVELLTSNQSGATLPQPRQGGNGRGRSSLLPILISCRMTSKKRLGCRTHQAAARHSCSYASKPGSGHSQKWKMCRALGERT